MLWLRSVLLLSIAVLLKGSLVRSKRSLHLSEIKSIVNLHNALRASFADGKFGVVVGNMNKLFWSKRLQRRAEEAISTCDRQHSNSLNLLEPLTFNIYRRSHQNFTQAILSWFSEVRHFLPEFHSCLFYKECLQMMTLLAAEHNYIGCAYRESCDNDDDDDNDIFLCLYRGGHLDETFYKGGQPCTKCKGLSSFCNSGLCVPCRNKKNCDCRKTCQSRVGTGILDNRTCTCSCKYGLGPNCDEECQNPQLYLDMDICEQIASREQCQTADPWTRSLLQEFCPEQCTCRKLPASEEI